MNVYDFDKTIYKYDSSVRFYLFCVKRNKLLLLHSPVQFFYLICYLLKLLSTKQYKQKSYTFLKYIKNINKTVTLFWDQEEENIESWYLQVKQPSDVVISASPQFLLAPICKRLQVGSLIGTDMDERSGQIWGENCKGKEKVVRFRQEFPAATIDKFYSDSLSDQPMADLAKESYMVKRGVRQVWKNARNR